MTEDEDPPAGMHREAHLEEFVAHADDFAEHFLCVCAACVFVCGGVVLECESVVVIAVVIIEDWDLDRC